jgi:hypothetical protein
MAAIFSSFHFDAYWGTCRAVLLAREAAFLLHQNWFPKFRKVVLVARESIS